MSVGLKSTGGFTCCFGSSFDFVAYNYTAFERHVGFRVNKIERYTLEMCTFETKRIRYVPPSLFATFDQFILGHIVNIVYDQPDLRRVHSPY